MKKKIFAAALASAMLLSLAGCNQDNGGSTTTQGGSETQAPTTTTAGGGDNTEQVENPPADDTDYVKAAVNAEKDPVLVDTGFVNPDGEGKVFNIAVWNDEWKGFFEKYYKVPDGVTVNFLSTPSEGGAYQNKLDTYLQNNESASADDKIDLFLAEADYIKKYACSDFTLDISTIGLSKPATAYNYTYDAATDIRNGQIKGASFQACPNALIYRKSIAKEVLGTDDPAEVQSKLDTWDKFNAVAADAKAKGYYMTPSVIETYRVFANSSTKCFIDENNNFQTQDGFEKWLAQAEEFIKNDYTINCGVWSDEKTAQMGKEGKSMCFFGPAWYYNFCMGTAVEQTPGDWAICKGPQEGFWGGTWMMVPVGTDNPSMTADVIKAFTENTDLLTQLVYKDNQFANHKGVMKSYADSPDYVNQFLVKGQNDIAIMYEIAENIKWDSNLHTQYDQTFNEKLPEVMQEYLKGVATKDEAFANFYKILDENCPGVTHP